jgi:HSF-type DNA-binding
MILPITNSAQSLEATTHGRTLSSPIEQRQCPADRTIRYLYLPCNLQQSQVPRSAVFYHHIQMSYDDIHRSASEIQAELASQPLSESGESQASQHQVPVQVSPTHHEHSSFTLLSAATDYPDVKRFPIKLFRLLDRAEAESFNHVISWEPHGRSFIVHDRAAFNNLLPFVMLGMGRWKSFQRQLYLWGFNHLADQRNVCRYYHDLFQKHQPQLLRCMRRGGYGDRSRGVSTVETRPDMDTMPFLTRSDPYQVNQVDEPSTREGSATDRRIKLDPSDGSSTAGHSEEANIDPLADCYRRGSIRGSRDSAAGMDGSAAKRMDQFDKKPNEWPRIRIDSDASDNPPGNVVNQRHSMVRLEEELSTEFNRELMELENELRFAGNPTEDLDGELEPRPLPPIITVQGEVTLYSYAPVPVAQHPGFAQIGPQEFYSSRRGRVAAQEQDEPFRESPEEWDR